jgi:hypothetical protein
VTFSSAETAARLQRKPCREWKSQFSYPKYNQSAITVQANRHRRIRSSRDSGQ